MVAVVSLLNILVLNSFDFRFAVYSFVIAFESILAYSSFSLMELSCGALSCITFITAYLIEFCYPWLVKLACPYNKMKCNSLLYSLLEFFLPVSGRSVNPKIRRETLIALFHYWFFFLIHQRISTVGDQSCKYCSYLK